MLGFNNIQVEVNKILIMWKEIYQGKRKNLYL